MNNPKSSHYRMKAIKQAWPVEKQTKPSCWACFFRPAKPKPQPIKEPEQLTEYEVLMGQLEMFKDMAENPDRYKI